MSGRLKISSKKSYCPWKAENLARVRADEKRHRDAQRQQKAQQAQGLRDQQWNALAASQEDQPSNHRHVNFFEKEERESILQTPEVVQKTAQRKPAATTHQVPFYLKLPCASTNNANDSQQDLTPKDTRIEQDRRRRLDPMSQFHHLHEYKKRRDTGPSRKEAKHGNRLEKRRYAAESSDDDSNDDNRHDSRHRKRSKRRRKKQRRKESRDKDSKKQTSSTPESLQELRRKRIEREQHEKERQSALDSK